ncbi:hypothetical protein Tco_0360764 [Tanacetum coccineum]
MAQENYVDGCFMQRPHFLEAEGFCFWKILFETYIKSKDIDLWKVIQNGDFVFMMKDPETKMDIETPNDGVISKSIKEKVKSLALKAKVSMGQTSNDSVCQDGSNEDKDKEEEFNSIVNNLWKLFKKGNRFERENRFGNGGDRFDRGRGIGVKVLEVLNENVVVMVAVERTTSLMLFESEGEKGVRWWSLE